LKKNYLAPV